MKKRVAIIGKGHVGSALHEGISRAGYETKITGKGAGVTETAAWGDIVILAVPFSAIESLLAELGAIIRGKIVVDVTNVLGPNGQLALGFSTSGAEQLQRKVPSAKVVKAFNTVFAQNMSTGMLNGKALTCFAAGDDAAAKADVLALARDIGYNSVDAGPLNGARWLEAMGFGIIQLAYSVNGGLGTAIGFTLIR
jgi:8-hydroxy-5-deazaflavin:NADPH oxidoreductase